MRRISSLAVAVILATGCSARLKMSPEDRGKVERTLQNEERDQYLRLSFFVTPFYGDSTRRLLTAVPPEEVPWLAEPNGETISPGPIESIVTAGTRVRITAVEFPTGWALTERMVYTPRFHPWIYVEVEGRPRDIPYILVMPPDLQDAASFLADLEKYLSRQDVRPRLAQWGDTVKSAIDQKRALPDMEAEALVMAWGYPERKRMTYDNGTRREEWLYYGNRRKAVFLEGRVVELTPAFGN